MLFVQISRDVLQLQHASRREGIHFGELERKYPAVLSEMLTQDDTAEILVINGPGGFASLRCGCLSINLEQMLAGGVLQVYNISKIQLYTYAYQQGWLPQYGVIYIGQKKNLWLYDFANQSYTTLHADNIRETLPQEYFLDDIEQHSLYEKLQRGERVRLSRTANGVALTYQGQMNMITLSELGLDPQTYIEPNYMMEPTIG